MKIIDNIGVKFAGLAIAAGLTVGSALAVQPGAVVDVNLPEPVSIGKITLPSGAYQVSQIPAGDSESFFVFRDKKGETAAVAEGIKDLTPAENQQTEVVLKAREDGTVHLDKLFLQGDTSGFKFVSIR